MQRDTCFKKSWNARLPRGSGNLDFAVCSANYVRIYIYIQIPVHDLGHKIWLKFGSWLVHVRLCGVFQWHVALTSQMPPDVDTDIYTKNGQQVRLELGSWLVQVTPYGVTRSQLALTSQMPLDDAAPIRTRI